jgi:hypothetical protein
MSEFARVFLVLMSEAIIVAAVLYSMLFVLVLNLRLIPEPAEDDWMFRLIFVGRHRRGVFQPVVLRRSIISAGALSALQIVETILETGKHIIVPVESAPKFPASAASSPAGGYILLDLRRLPNLHIPTDVSSGGRSNTQIVEVRAKP